MPLRPRHSCSKSCGCRCIASRKRRREMRCSNSSPKDRWQNFPMSSISVHFEWWVVSIVILMHFANCSDMYHGTLQVVGLEGNHIYIYIVILYSEVMFEHYSSCFPYNFGAYYRSMHRKPAVFACFQVALQNHPSSWAAILARSAR